MEIKILIEAPELAAAVNNLATAVSNFGEIKIQPVINAADVTDKAVKQTRRRKSDKSAAEEVPAQVEAPGVQTPDAPATAPVEPPHTVPGPAPVPPLTPASEAPVAPVAQQPRGSYPCPGCTGSRSPAARCARSGSRGKPYPGCSAVGDCRTCHIRFADCPPCYYGFPCY